MNIGLFTDTYFPQINGVGTSAHTLAQELISLGHNVYIFTPSDPRRTDIGNEKIIEMKSMPCFIVRNFRIGLLYSPQELIRIKKLNLDVIHTQTEFSQGTFGKIMAKTLGIPMVHTYHTMYEDYVHYIARGHIITPSMSHTFSRIFCNSADAVIAPTKKVYDSLISYGVKKKISIIPTGIQIDKFLNENYDKNEITALKKNYGLDNDNPVILVLGRIAEEKSIDFIIKALPKVFDNIPKARLLIVGDGPYRQVIEETVDSCKIRDKTIFTGAKPWSEIGKYYQMGDVLVSASVSETQGLTFVEAMSSGILVLARNDKCVSDLIKNGKSGYIFNSQSELEEKLTFILKNRNDFDDIKKEALILAESYSSHEFGKKVEELYIDMLEYPEKYGIGKTLRLSDLERAEPLNYKNLKRIKLTTQNISKIKRSTKNIKAFAMRPAKAVVKLVYKNYKGGN